MSSASLSSEPLLDDATDDMSRDQARQAFAEQHLGAGVEPVALPADASFRRYYRVVSDGGTSWLLMDAPPEHENLAAYLRVAGYLHTHGFSAPAIKAQDLAQGFALIEDFGDQTYTRLLNAGAEEAPLYALAIDALAALHQKPLPNSDAGFDLYNKERLLTEASLFPDWYWAYIKGEGPTSAERSTFMGLVEAQLDAVANRQVCVVLRDYHVDNLMLRPDQAAGSLESCGLLDFQDALIGAKAYDLMSLLEDARRDLSDDLVAAMIDRYCAALPGTDRDVLMADYKILGMTRHAKILGIFVRLNERDGKPKYLKHLPRVARLLARSLTAPSLVPMAQFLDDACPGWRNPPQV
ncbi:MAG: phosphotransferase [Alphaproteobacteria bacterium]|nr:phosphotransferase [Alphaproteobacteria bacterium SS10]